MQIDVINANDTPMRLIIEPWANEYHVEPGVTTQFVFQGPEPVQFDIESRPDALVVYGWTGSIYDDGDLPSGPPVPAMP